MVEPGRRCLGDRYELEQLIAAGGMGQVWRGHDILLHRPVAVKVLRSEYTGDPTFLARFRAEAQHAASLSHPNIAAVFDYGEVVAEDGSGETLAYLVMELVEGEPLSAVLHREAPLDTAATLSVMRQTAFALADAHRVGMVHRDVKPGNILVRADGSVKITDFGIAWSAGSVPLTRTGQVIGTAQYLSPEQAEGRHPTPASDVYALGLVGYECLVGHAAFEGDNPVTIALKQVRQQPDPLPSDLPSGVRTLVMRALAKDPAARYPDGAAFVEAIELAIAGKEPETVAAGIPVVAEDPAAAPTEPTATPVPASGSHSISPPPRRRRSMALVLLSLLLVLGGAGVGFVYLQSASDDGGSAPAAATKKLDARGILLEAGDFVGRPVDQVVDELTRRGLVVQLQPVVAGDVPAGDVTDLSPSGVELRTGDTVVVSYARAPEETTDPGRGSPAGPAAGGEQVPAEVTDTDEQEPIGTTEPAPTTSPPPATSTSSDAGGTSASTSSSSASSATSSPSATSTATTTAGTTPSTASAGSRGTGSSTGDGGQDDD